MNGYIKPSAIQSSSSLLLYGKVHLLTFLIFGILIFDNPIATAQTKDSTKSDITFKNDTSRDNKFVTYEVIPEFPGGTEKFLLFIKDRVKNPSIYSDGRVAVNFMIGTDGSISDVKVIKTPNAEIAREVKSIILKSPRWHAGKRFGKSVNVTYNLIINLSNEQLNKAEKLQSQKVKIDEPVCAVNRDKLIKGTEGEYYYGLENKPEFPGGWDKYKPYLKEYFKHLSNTGSGKKRVTLSLIVERDGSLSNFKILRSQGDELDNVAIEALKHSGRWTPGRIGKEPVRSLFLVPVEFN